MTVENLANRLKTLRLGTLDYSGLRAIFVHEYALDANLTQDCFDAGELIMKFKWQEKNTAPPETDEKTIFVIKVQTNSMFFPVAVQWFEGNLYPIYKDCNINYSDSIPDHAWTHWMPNFEWE
jgi:hypothetical protein